MELKLSDISLLQSNFRKLLIAPIMELKLYAAGNDPYFSNTFNRTNYGIETTKLLKTSKISTSFNRTNYGIETKFTRSLRRF